MKLSIITHLTAAVLCGLIVLLLYVAVLQTYCTAVNRPQTGRHMTKSIKYSRTYRFVDDSGVAARQMPGTFMQLYSKNGQLLYSGGTINGKAPHLPGDILDNKKQQTSNAVTGQPTTNVRLAAVATYTTMPDNAFVVVVRSLQEVENYEIRLITMIVLFWAVGCGIIAMHWLAHRSIK